MMRKYCLIIFIFCLPCISKAQEGYLVEYEFNDIMMPLTLNGEMRIVKFATDMLVIGDTLALEYRPANGSVKRKGIYGAKALHHSRFTTVNGGRYYDVVAWPKRNHPYLVTDTLYGKDWVMTGEKKQILGYHCERAYHLNTKRDTVSAWFTRAIPFPLGPRAQGGLPGLILELEEHINDILIRVKKIERGNYAVAFPHVDRIVEASEKRVKKKKPD